MAVTYYKLVDEYTGDPYWVGSDGSLKYTDPAREQPRPTYSYEDVNAALAQMPEAQRAEYLLGLWQGGGEDWAITQGDIENDIYAAFLGEVGGALYSPQGHLMIPRGDGTYTVTLSGNVDGGGSEGNQYGSYGMVVDEQGRIVQDPTFFPQERSGSWLSEHPWAAPLFPVAAFFGGQALGLGEVGGTAASATASGTSAGFTNPLTALSNTISGGLTNVVPALGTEVLGTTYANIATNSLINGTINKLLGGDFGTGMLTGAVGSVIPGTLSAAGMDSAALRSVLTPVVGAAASTAIRGGTFEDFARAAGTNLLTASAQQIGALRNIFSATEGEIDTSSFSADELNRSLGGMNDGAWLGAWEDMALPEFYSTFGFDDPTADMPINGPDLGMGPTLSFGVDGAVPPQNEFSGDVPLSSSGGTQSGWPGASEDQWGGDGGWPGTSEDVAPAQDPYQVQDNESGSRDTSTSGRSDSWNTGTGGGPPG